ncbi:type II secretion system F family protein [Candidatus Entotheonella palauensis]|uniref:type II secretion system F family protein n=1 Tax=Candidatus Entotheonella palauensis TaxID=93172 RepID=UPI0015C4DCB3|nr:type II secretion system F family protein [Candidatus Entotheonella palauensis]
MDFLGTLPLIRPRREGEISRARSRLTQAGFHNPRDLNIYYGVKFGLMAFLVCSNFLLLQVLSPAQSPSTSLLIAALLMSALVGTFAPDLWLQLRIKERKELIWRGFPDAMDLLVLCIESGLGIDAAMHRVSEDLYLTHPLLSQELRHVSDSIRSGQSRTIALKQLNQRVDLEDIQSFTSLIIQTDKLGVSITQAMRRISESIRNKRRIKAEELAAKLPVKLLFPVTLFFFPSIMVVVLLPAAMKLVQALSNAAGN